MACTDIPVLPIALPSGIPGCCTTPSLDFSVDVSRTGAVICVPPVPQQTHTALLVFDGLSAFVGTFLFATDTYTVTLSTAGGTWTLTISNNAGCGLSLIVYSQTAASPYGPWPDATIPGTGVCGCSSLFIQYSNPTVTG